MRNADLEAARDTALALSEVELGSDLELGFYAITLMNSLPGSGPSGVAPTIAFFASSHAAAKSAHVGFYGRIGRFSISVRSDPPAPNSGWAQGHESAPWRDDPTWIDLVRASWLRLKPFEGEVTLYRVPSERIEAGPRAEWIIKYVRTIGGVEQVPIYYRYRDHSLVDSTGPGYPVPMNPSGVASAD